MSQVEWNLFAEGKREELELPRLETLLTTFFGAYNQIIYIKRECEVCHETLWIKHPFAVCSNCIP